MTEDSPSPAGKVILFHPEHSFLETPMGREGGSTHLTSQISCIALTDVTERNEKIAEISGQQGLFLTAWHGSVHQDGELGASVEA